MSLRKTPLHRYTPLRSTGRLKRAKNGRAQREQWAESQSRCALCHRPFKHRSQFEGHHVCKWRKGRLDDPRNLLALCGPFFIPPCHLVIEGLKVPRQEGGYWPPITFAMQLTMLSELGVYDPVFLQAICGKRLLPEPEPIPECYLLERIYWDGCNVNRVD